MKLNFLKIKTIKTKITLIVILLFIFISLIISFFTFKKFTNDYQIFLAQKESVITDFISKELESDLFERFNGLNKVTRSFENDKFGPSYAQEILENRPILDSYFNAGLFITDKNGITIASTMKTIKRIGVDYSDRDYIKTILFKNIFSLSTPIIGRVIKQPIITMGTPIHGTNGKVIGALVGVIDLSRDNFISHMLKSYSKNNSKLHILFPEVNLELSLISNNVRLDEISNPKKFKPNVDDSFKIQNNELLTYKKLPQFNWVIMTKIPTFIVFEPLKQLRSWLIIRLILGILGISTMIWWVLRWQLNSITTITREIDNITNSDDDFNLLTEIKKDEIGGLVNKFNELLIRKNNLQAQLIQSDRMSVMGQLAAGVAHEINNPLTYINLNLREAQQLISEANSNQNIQDALNRINDAFVGIDRVNKIVKGLSTFTRIETSDISIIDIKKPIEIALSLVKNKIKYLSKIDDDNIHSGYVLANEGQLAQVFLNILLNASQSLKVEAYENNLIIINTKHDESSIYINIIDNGIGIEKINLERIFDPFYTTKASGVGSGLGLTISKNIIRNFNGEIFIKSELGFGTEVTVKLPLQKK
jgi:signal transduction histidine kinase